MDYFLSHQNQINMKENKKVQTDSQIFQKLHHLILNIKMVSLLLQEEKKLYIYFRNSDATWYRQLCFRGIKQPEKGYAGFALLLIRPKMQYKAEPRTQFSLITREGIPVAEIISEHPFSSSLQVSYFALEILVQVKFSKVVQNLHAHLWTTWGLTFRSTKSLPFLTGLKGWQTSGSSRTTCGNR